MISKRLFIPLVVVIAVFTGLWFYRHGADSGVPAPHPPPHRKAPLTTFPPASPPDPSRIAMQTPPPEELATVSPNPMAAAIGSANLPPQKEIALVLGLFQTYRREFGSFPAGETNRQFMNALRGGNPRKLPIFPQKHPRLDAQGNLLDPWGQPYLFHAVARDRLEIRSKGPDHEIFTADDLVAPENKPQ